MMVKIRDSRLLVGMKGRFLSLGRGRNKKADETNVEFVSPALTRLRLLMWWLQPSMKPRAFVSEKFVKTRGQKSISVQRT